MTHKLEIARDVIFDEELMTEIISTNIIKKVVELSKKLNVLDTKKK